MLKVQIVFPNIGCKRGIGVNGQYVIVTESTDMQQSMRALAIGRKRKKLRDDNTR